jgi:hypothetical protein
MDMSKYVGSKFLTAADYPRPAILTIQMTSEDPIGEEQQVKPIVWFEKVERGLVLNRTNMNMLIELFGLESDAWAGQRIEIFTDPNVTYAGRRTPALRLRAPQQRVAPPVAPARGLQPNSVVMAPPARGPVPRVPPTEGLVYDESIPDPA